MTSCQPPGPSISTWGTRLGGSFKATILVNTVDQNSLEYYGLGIFIYNSDAGHFGNNTRNIWSREDYANGSQVSGSQKEMHVPPEWRDFGLGILLATVDQGVSIGLSPDPGFFSVYQGTGGMLAADGGSYRWDANSYLIAINTPGSDGYSSENLILHITVPDAGVGFLGTVLTFLGIICGRFVFKPTKLSR